MPFGAFILILIFNFGVGWIIACFFSGDEDELCALILPLSFGLTGFSTLPSLFLKINYFPASLITTAAVTFLFLTFEYFFRKESPLRIFRQKYWNVLKHIRKNPGVIFIYSLILVHLLAHQSLVPFYGAGSLPGDWFGHYRLIQDFLNHTVTEFPMRLPFYQLIQVFNISFFTPPAEFGQNFYLVQIIQVIIGFSFYPIVYLLFKKLFNESIGLLVLLFAAFLPYIFVQAICPWPKLLASNFVLLAYYYFSKLKSQDSQPKHLWMFAAFCGLSILAHWSGAIYSLCLLVIFVLQFKSFKIKTGLTKNISVVILVILLVLSPFYFWGFTEFGFSESIKANLSLIQKPEYSMLKSVASRFVNFFTTLFFPLSIMIGLFRELPGTGLNQTGWIDLISRSFSWHFGSIPGNISMTLTIFLLIKLHHKFRATVNTWYSTVQKIMKRIYQYFQHVDSSSVYFIFGGILLMIVLQPVPITAGVSLSGLLPSAIFLFGFTLNYYIGQNNSWTLPLLLFFECLFIVWLWQGFLWYLDKNYAINLTSSNPAILQLNEVVQYKRNFNLTFLATFFHAKMRWLIIVIALLIEFTLVSVAIRMIKRNTF